MSDGVRAQSESDGDHERKRTGPDRLGPNRLGSDRFGSDRFGSDRFGSDRTGPRRNGVFRTGAVRCRAVRAGSENRFGAEGGGTGAVRTGGLEDRTWGWCGPERFGPERAGGLVLDGATCLRASHAREVEHPVKAAGRPVKVTGHFQEVEHPVKSVGVN